MLLMGSLTGGRAREGRPGVSSRRCCVAARLCFLAAPGWRVECATWKLSFSSGHFNLTRSLDASILSLAVNNPKRVDGGASWWLFWRLLWQRPQGSAASPPQASSASCLPPLPPQWGSAGKDEFTELSLLFLQYSDNSLSLDLLWTFKQPSFFFFYYHFPKMCHMGPLRSLIWPPILVPGPFLPASAHSNWATHKQKPSDSFSSSGRRPDSFQHECRCHSLHSCLLVSISAVENVLTTTTSDSYVLGRHFQAQDSPTVTYARQLLLPLNLFPCLNPIQLKGYVMCKLL